MNLSKPFNLFMILLNKRNGESNKEFKSGKINNINVNGIII